MMSGIIFENNLTQQRGYKRIMQKIAHNMKVHKLCASADIAAVLIKRNTGLTTHVACMRR